MHIALPHAEYLERLCDVALSFHRPVRAAPVSPEDRGLGTLRLAEEPGCPEDHGKDDALDDVSNRRPSVH